MKRKIYKCGIIGYPLNKPRSVNIWKKYFKENSISATMNSFEVESSKLTSFFNKFKNNNYFKSLLITMPYKKKIIRYANKLDSTVKSAKSANLLVKKKKNIIAYNTDVLGAYYSLKPHINKYNNIIILGIGGSGEAIFRYLYFKHRDKKYVLVSSKFKYKAKNVTIKKNLDLHILRDKSIIINCTPLGSNLKREYITKLPIPKNFFKTINGDTLIFDIIYKPKNTKLKSLCKKYKIEYINGLEMNSVQAIKALNLTFGPNKK